jgi:ligand-binding sensor domain-containing protein
MRYLTLALTLIFCFALQLSKAAEPVKVTRIITVRDGLPQSYVSGIFQDASGFLWVATLNGLGRYDGREFKTYQHTSANANGLGGNIILNFFNAGNNNLWLCYRDDKIDQLNTITGKITHLSDNKTFGLLKGQAGYFKSLVRDSRGTCWMMAHDGGIYSIDSRAFNVKYFSAARLGLREPVLGIAVINNKLTLFTRSALNICNDAAVVIQNIPYPFKITKPDNTVQNIYAAVVRTNGDVIVGDSQGIAIWNPSTNFLKQIPMVRLMGPGKVIGAFDHSGNLFFEFNGGLAMLTANNTLVNQWAPVDASMPGSPTCVYADRSGVLWVGSNGFGLRQYNLVKTGLPGFPNQHAFMGDALIRTGVPPTQIAHTFLNKATEFANRSTTYHDSVWVANVFTKYANPQLLLSVNKQVTLKTFKNEDQTAGNETRNTKFLGTGGNGTLWAIDEQQRFLKFDAKKLTYKVYGKADIDEGEDITGLVPDEAGGFYISSVHNLCRVNLLTGRTENLTRFLPSKDILDMTNDPDDKAILWIGTLSDGLIRFNTQTKKVQVYSTATGLPNNTIYSVLFGNDNLMWCSTNKGIFALDKKTQAIRSFTSRDGLVDDEYNRYYFMKLPNGELAFGGPMGYTVFNPSKLEIDDFNPRVALTRLSIINRPDEESLGTVNELNLRYDQNFITAEFAAMQFDIPEKIQYRYMLKGLDKNWIMLGNANKASYTSLPPGTYTLMLNATNTAGKWSTHIPQIKINIAAPYWRTWWFYQVVFLTLVVIVCVIVKSRIRRFHKAQAQKLQFEREAMELHAMALRARMNPHFIFNCLNSIKALIQEKDDQKAVNYLTTFSILIRNQLNNKSNQITLQDELETCKLYLELEAMRFEGRIAYRFDIADDEELKQTIVPPLILQPIVENAIVHGLLPLEEGGAVSIKVYRDGDFGVCEIEDNGIGRAAAEVNKQKSSRLHQSKGINLLEERITMHNRMNEHVGSLETIDLFTPEGKAAGTLVIIKFNIDI